MASQFLTGWHWGVARVYFLFFTTGMLIALAARRSSVWPYKAGAALSLVAGFGLGLSNMLHLADSENPANLWYYSVLVTGAIGHAVFVLLFTASGLLFRHANSLARR